jgi:tetratricopeptide (TPR) repeat protein
MGGGRSKPVGRRPQVYSVGQTDDPQEEKEEAQEANEKQEEEEEEEEEEGERKDTFEEDDDNKPSSRSVGKFASASDLAAAVAEVTEIQVNEIALVRRSDRQWRYARFRRRTNKGMHFVVDSTGQEKVIPRQRYSEVQRLPLENFFQRFALLPTVASLDSSSNSLERQIQTSTTKLELSLHSMVEARKQLEKDLEGFAVDPSEDEAQTCSESTQHVIEAWIKMKGHVEAAATALQESAKEGDVFGSVESAIDFAKLVRAILVELRTSVATLTKKTSILAQMGKGKVVKVLQSALKEALQLLKGEAALLKKRLASDPDAIRILEEARGNLVCDCKAFLARPGEEAWKGCSAGLRTLVDSWAAVRRAIMAAVEELRGKARDTDLGGGAKSAVVLARLLRGALSELLELMKALREMKEQVQGMEGMEGATKAARKALKKARVDLKAIRSALMDTSAEQILEGAELQQLKAESAVDEGGALLNYAEMLVQGLSMIPIPGVQSVCEMMRGAIGAAKNAHTLASDALEITGSVIEIGRNMRYMKRLANRMDEEAKQELQYEMGRLTELLGEMKDAIETFGQKGFFRKMFAATKVVRRLASMERRKEAIMSAMDRVLQRVQIELNLDQRDRVQLETKEHTYALVKAVWSKLEERTKANGGNVDVEADVTTAAGEIMRDPAALQEVADSAGLSEEVFKDEMAAVREGLEELKGVVIEEHAHTRDNARQVAVDSAEAKLIGAKAERDYLLERAAGAPHARGGDQMPSSPVGSTSPVRTELPAAPTGRSNSNGSIAPQVASMIDRMATEEMVQLAENWKEILRHDETHPLLKEGREHYKVKNYEEAIGCFKQVIDLENEKRPREVKQAKRLAMMAHIQIGTELLLQKQYNKAVFHFEDALEFREGSDKRMHLVREYHACTVLTIPLYLLYHCTHCTTVLTMHCTHYALYLLGAQVPRMLPVRGGKAGTRR